jgi:ABC-type branched-subunit amino acid transport system permease subunit
MKIKNFALVFLAIAIPVLALLPLPDFWIVQLNYIGLYALVCLGLVLLTGVAGLTSFGQAAFVGIGAYTTAWLTLNTGMSPVADPVCRSGHHCRQRVDRGGHYPAHVRALPAPGHHCLGTVALLSDGQPGAIGKIRRPAGA